MKRRVLGVTGSRAEYDIAYSVYRALGEAGVEVSLAVTGAHLAPEYGLTIGEIERDGFPIAGVVENLLSSNRKTGRVKGLGLLVTGLAQLVDRERPDMLLVVGDREEAMATALVGAYLDVAVAHVAGGDRVVGNVDDQVRHAVTKLSHLHFVTNRESEERVLRLGEQPFRVMNSGNPGLDRLLAVPPRSREQLSQSLGFELGARFVIVIQHPLSSEAEQAYPQMLSTLQALSEAGERTLIVYPNSDPGSAGIVRAIGEFAATPGFCVVRNLDRVTFVNVLRQAACMVGNSSAGILEAPLLKLPVINTGNRQAGRLHAANVLFVGHSVTEIRAALARCLEDPAHRQVVRECENPYGDGHAGRRIAQRMASVPIDRELLIKDITY